VAAIGSAYRTSIPILGSGAAGVFLVSLIASGLSSSAVGTMAGQVIMQGFVRFRIPLWLRRLVTMVPSFAIVAVGFDATRALVLSQVVLSLQLSFAVIPLVLFTSDRRKMGAFVIPAWMKVLAWIVVVLIVALNAKLLADTFGITGWIAKLIS